MSTNPTIQDNTIDAHIAVAWGSPGGATAEISNAIEDLIGKRPKPVRLGDLAGPNETIQVLLSTEDWINLAKWIIIIFGTELIKEAAKATWKASASKFLESKEAYADKFSKLFSAIKQARHAHAPVIFGFFRTPLHGRRHIGIEIQSDDPEEICRTIKLLAANGKKINKKLDELDNLIKDTTRIGFEENSDCSVKILLTDEGVLQLKTTQYDEKYKNPKETTYEFFE